MTSADPSQNASPVQPDSTEADVAPQGSGAIAQGIEVAVVERSEEAASDSVETPEALSTPDEVSETLEASNSKTTALSAPHRQPGGLFHKVLAVIQDRRSQIADAQTQAVANLDPLTDAASLAEEAEEGAFVDGLEVSIAGPEVSAPEIAGADAAIFEVSVVEAAEVAEAEATGVEGSKGEADLAEAAKSFPAESTEPAELIEPAELTEPAEPTEQIALEVESGTESASESVGESEATGTALAESALAESASEVLEPHSSPEESQPESSSRLAQRRWLIGAAAGATVLGVGVASYFAQQRAGGPTPDNVLSLIPSNAIAAVQITDDRTQWESLRRIGTPALQRGVGQWLALGRDRINNLGYGDWQKLQSQIAGDVALALVPTDASATESAIPGRPNTAPPDLLLVVPVKNPGAIQREIDNLEPPEGFDNQTFSYRGVEVFEIQANLAQRHAIALLGGFWVMAADTATVERAIDSFFDRQSILQLQDLRRSRSQLATSTSGDAFMELYLNSPAATEAALAAGRLLPLPNDIEGLTARFSLSGNGFAVSSLTWQPPRDRGLSLLTDSSSATEPVELTQLFGDRFPASTSLLLSGNSFKDAWASYGRRGTSSLFSADALREQVRAVTTMDLDKEWLSWMDGPYSVGILPIPSRANSRFQTGLTVMVQTSNRRTAERSLQKLDSLMVNKYGMRLNTGKLAGQPVVNWSSAEGEPVVTHGWLENNVAFLIVGAPGANSLLPPPRATLAGSPLFREGMPRQETEARRSTGEMFVDVDRFSKTNLISLLPFPTGTQPLVGALKSFGAERTIVDEALTRYDLSFQFLRSFETPETQLPPNQSSEPEADESEAQVNESETAEETESVEAEASLESEVEEPTEEPTEVTDEETDEETDEATELNEDTSEESLPDEESQEESQAEQAPVSQTQAERSRAARAEEPLGPDFPLDAYDRLNLGPNLPRPNETPWSDNFAGEERTPIGGADNAEPQGLVSPDVAPETEPDVAPEAEPAVDAVEIQAEGVEPNAELELDSEPDAVSRGEPNYLKPFIPSGPPLPTPSDRQAFGPQKN